MVVLLVDYFAWRYKMVTVKINLPWHNLSEVHIKNKKKNDDDSDSVSTTSYSVVTEGDQRHFSVPFDRMAVSWQVELTTAKHDLAKAAGRYYANYPVHNVLVTPGNRNADGSIKQVSAFHWTKCHYVAAQVQEMYDSDDMYKAEKKAGWYYGNCSSLTFLHPCTACQQNTLKLQKYSNGELPMDSVYMKLLESSTLGIPPFVRNKREKVSTRKSVAEPIDVLETAVKRSRNLADGRELTDE